MSMKRVIGMRREDLFEIAKTIELPEWATHVSVRSDGTKVEPAAWLEKANGYIDEDPKGIMINEWVSCYKPCYWEFFSISELNTEA